MTVAPRCRAARAIANPILPDDGVADKPHRIDGLPGRPGRNENGPAGKIVRRHHGGYFLHNKFRLGQTPGPDRATRQLSGIRIDQDVAIATQDFQIALDGRVLVHVRIHGRANDHRGCHGQHVGG